MRERGLGGGGGGGWPRGYTYITRVGGSTALANVYWYSTDLAGGGVWLIGYTWAIYRVNKRSLIAIFLIQIILAPFTLCSCPY